jgi:hypothetical protein
MLTVTSIRTTLAATITVAAAVTAIPFGATATAAPAEQEQRARHWTQSGCVEVEDQRNLDVCAKRTMKQTRNGDLIQTSTTIYVSDRDCRFFSGPDKATISSYSVVGLKRGDITPDNNIVHQQNLVLGSNCSNTDSVNRMTHNACSRTRFTGKAKLVANSDSYYTLYLMAGPCAKPANDAWDARLR